MDLQYLDLTRRQIERHFSRVIVRSYNSFWTDCRLLSQWISTHPLLRASVLLLKTKAAIYRTRMINIADQFAAGTRGLTANDYIATQSFEDQAAIAWAALDLVAQTEGEPHTGKFHAICRVMTDHAPQGAGGVVEVFQSFVMPILKDYLYDYLDCKDVTLYLLEKYKKKCEWFWRERLRAQAQIKFEGVQKGERSLAIHLYDYLHDQGFDFAIEPSSPGGRIDALASQWAIDAKYIPASSPSEIIRKLSFGFRQVADYCNIHHRAAGYLVAYKEHDLVLQLELESVDGSSFLKIGDKTIYYCEIDITDYDSTVSKRGTASILPISRADLITLIPAT